MKIKYEASKEIFKYYNELTVISQRLKKIEKGGNIIIVNQIIRCILCIFAFTFYIFIVGRIEPTIFINDINRFSGPWCANSAISKRSETSLLII